MMPADSSHPKALGRDVEWKAELVVLNPLAELTFQCSPRKNCKLWLPGMENVLEVAFSSEHTTPCQGFQSPQTPALLSGAESEGIRKESLLFHSPFAADRLLPKVRLLIPLLPASPAARGLGRMELDSIIIAFA